jgi:hypothetical protein
VLVPTGGTSSFISTASTQQYTLTSNDGNTWANMDVSGLKLTITPSTGVTAVVSGNSDLWTSVIGYNQDLGIWISGGTYGAGQLVAWKESGGMAATNSPSAAYVESALPLQAATTYTITLQWKANRSDPGTIWAGAGAGASFSPTRLTAFTPG